MLQQSPYLRMYYVGAFIYITDTTYIFTAVLSKWCVNDVTCNLLAKLCQIL